MTRIEGSGGCFVDTTLVSVPYGKTPIVELKEGDLVLSFDDHGEIHEAKILKVHKHPDEEVWEYKFWGGASFKATPSHWVLNQFNAFVPVGSLGGDDCVVNQDGHLLPIIAKAKIGYQPVFNLTVENQHTFIAENIRVHNAGLGAGIRGSGGGGGSKGGGGQYTPTEADDSLQSVQYASVLDLISEGEIQGLDTGDEKSVFLDNTPVKDDSGNKNFEKYSYAFRTGTQDQAYITDLKGTEQEVPVGTTLGNTTGNDAERISGATVRTVQKTSGADKIRITITTPSLQSFSDKGDVNGNSVKLQIEVKYDSGSYASVLPNNADGTASTGDTWNGKSSASYQRDYVFTLSTTSWTTASIRVSRVTRDSTSSKSQNQISWTSYTTIIDEKLRYPNSALAYLRFDARTFRNIPARKYKIRGIKVKIPANATVDTSTHIGRVTYSGTWNGTWKAAEFCSDPAWCLYDLLINDRYGAGIPESTLDKWDFYAISQYCNELVSNGRGGQEPRFLCNLLLNERSKIYSVIAAMSSIFRGISYYAAGSLVLLQDKPTDSQYLIGPSNVIDGAFEYTGTSQSARHTVCSIAYQDYDSLGEVEYEQVEDADAIAKYGVTNKQVRALGCYSQGQAHRVGKWLLLSEQNLTETVSFAVSIESGLVLRPGMVIDIADPVKSGYRRTGRINTATTTAITIDFRTDLSSVDMTKSPKIAVMLPTGLMEERTITAIEATTQKVIDVSPAFSEAPEPQAVFLIQTDDVLSQQFRIISVGEAKGNVYGVSALKYNSTIYNAVEQNLAVTQRDISNLTDAPPAVTGVTGSQYMYQRGQSVLIGFSLGWTSGGARTHSYSIDYRMGSDNWQTVQTNSPSINLESLRAGTLEVRIQAINYVGVGSTITSNTFTLPGKTDPPGDVQNLTFESINQNSGRLRWTQSTDLDVRVGGKIFIRHSSLTDGNGTWSNSVDLIEAKSGSATEAVIPKVEGEVLVKFADSEGNLSTNEASVIINLATKNQFLTVINQREDQISPTPFSGSKTDCSYDATADALELDVTNGAVESSGTYLFADTMDLGATYALDLVRYFVTRGNFQNDLIDNWPDVDQRLDWDGGIIAMVNATTSIRSTTGDPSGSPTWSGWQPLGSGTFNGRAFQFKTDLTSGSTDQNILVDQLGYHATLDQRTEQSSGPIASTTASGGKNITFTNAFFTGTSTYGGSATAYLPSIGIVGQNLQSGDFFNVTNVSATGFTVKFENGSSVVNRNFTWTAVGFGRRA